MHARRQSQGSTNPALTDKKLRELVFLLKKGFIPSRDIENGIYVANGHIRPFYYKNIGCQIPVSLFSSIEIAVQTEQSRDTVEFCLEKLYAAMQKLFLEVSSILRFAKIFPLLLSLDLAGGNSG